MNNNDIFNFLNGFNTGYCEPIPKTQQLKDRMRTKIIQAKKYDKQEFIRLLAEDYIRISKEL